jgi:hypothetical protein
MATAGGPNIERDGLVFGYDTGYGVADNNTATRFYPGEPTTNFMPTIYKAGATSSGTDEIGDYFEGTITRIGCPNGTSIDSGATYTFSIEIRADKTFNMSADSNQYAPENAGNDANRVSVSYIMPNYTTPGKWVKYSTTVVMKSGLTNPYMFDFFIPQSFTGRMYYRNAQLEYKNNPTPFVNGTRSSTQSLIDLKTTADIDVGNVSFDSTGQPTFDGTDDYIEATVNSITDETSLTISYWFKMNWPSSWSPFVTLMDSNGTQKFHTWFGSDRGIDFQTNINSAKPMFVASSTNYPNNEYINVVMVINGSGTNNVKCYVNAIYKAQGSLSFNTHDIDKLRIGRDPGNAYGGGHMPRVAIYNVPLTEPEISQNFNAYKNRFNL